VNAPGAAVSRRTVLRAALASGLAAMMATACRTRQPTSLAAEPTSLGGTKVQLLTAEGVSRETPRHVRLDATVKGMTDFAYRLYQLTATPGSNSALSPLSIAVCFAMARAGARGKTAAEIDSVFSFPSDVHAAFNQLVRDVVTVEGAPPKPSGAKTRSADAKPAPPVVCVANGLFAQHGLPIGAEFLRVLGAQYGSGVYALAFRSPQASARINAWVAEQTAGRIKKLFEQLSENIKLVLANTVYLKADWANPFAEKPARDEPFSRADGSRVVVPMMHNEQPFRYAAGGGWQAVELPYRQSELAMWVLVPGPGRTPGDLLVRGVLADASRKATRVRVNLSMPRWDFETYLNLLAPLAKLGLDAARSDFSGINPELILDQAVHRTRITVDEWGTEAAAVTGMAFLTALPPPAEVTVRADRPFAFTITHTPTRTPLFLGHVADPKPS